MYWIFCVWKKNFHIKYVGYVGNYIHFQENVEEENSQENDVSQDDTPGGVKELNYYGNNLFYGVHNTG